MNKKMILITHGSLGKTLIETTEKILGTPEADILIYMSNSGISLDELIKKIGNIVDKNIGTAFILATDFPGGSCFIASKKISSSRENIFTVSGVNISMVLSFLTKKEMYEIKQLSDVIKTDGTRAILS